METSPKKFAIIGSGGERELLRRQLDKANMEDVVIITPDEAKELVNDTEASYVKYPSPTDLSILEITNSMRSIYGDKPFKCKGKHQYREVRTFEGKNVINTEWICQCGRKL